MSNGSLWTIPSLLSASRIRLGLMIIRRNKCRQRYHPLEVQNLTIAASLSKNEPHNGTVTIQNQAHKYRNHACGVQSLTLFVPVVLYHAIAVLTQRTIASPKVPAGMCNGLNRYQHARGVVPVVKTVALFHHANVMPLTIPSLVVADGARVGSMITRPLRLSHHLHARGIHTNRELLVLRQHVLAQLTTANLEVNGPIIGSTTIQRQEHRKQGRDRHLQGGGPRNLTGL